MDEMLKNMKKTTKSNLITYGMVIAAFIIVQILTGTGNISSLLEGLMVPLCIYSILAVSLNLVVGFLGELSLGHAGFMCVGAFTSAFFSKCVQDTITVRRCVSSWHCWWAPLPPLFSESLSEFRYFV